MKITQFFLSILFCITIISCAKDKEINIENSLVETLNKELIPLKNDPLLWEDSELQFLNYLGEKKIVGLGEATHGTSEFFKSKHRIFKYLVEHHNFKVFAIEADFGESILINEAIQSGDCDKIRSLMNDNMHFWTWQTEEVEQLLNWMCNYNISKEAEEKLHYYGVDCSYNTFHPDMVLEYLTDTKAPFIENSKEILTEAKVSSKNSFNAYTEASFNDYLDRLSNLKDTLGRYEDFLIEQSSKKEFELNKKLIGVIIQASEVIRMLHIGNFENDPRDPRMAENSLWLLDFFEEKKMSIWAHNGHLDNNLSSKSMGYYLAQELGSDYGSIGFSFSKGSFTAVGSGGLKTRSIEIEPKTNSLNYHLSEANESQFSINIEQLTRNREWEDKFKEQLEYLHVGAVYNGPPENYYNCFESVYFDELIYFDRTTETKIF